MKMLDLLTLRKTIAPRIITLIYLLGVIVIAVAGVSGVFMGQISTNGFGQTSLTIAGTLFFLMIWRVFNELWIVIFNIHDHLVSIRDLLSQGKAVPAAEHAPTNTL